MKRIIAFVLMIAITASLFCIPTNAVDRIYPTRQRFEDVVIWEDWFSDCVDYCVGHGIMEGVTDTRFAPMEAITRGDFVTALYRLAGSPDTVGAMEFTDVAKGSACFSPVLWAAKNGIVRGMTAATFAAERPLTREQMACLVIRYMESVDAKPDKSFDYEAPEDVSPYAKEAVSKMVRFGLLVGDNQKQFYLHKYTTRAQTAMVLMRLQILLENVPYAVLYENSTGKKWEISLEDTQSLRKLLQPDEMEKHPIAEYVSEYALVFDGMEYDIGYGEYKTGYFDFPVRCRYLNEQRSGSVFPVGCSHEEAAEWLVALVDSYRSK